MNVLDLTSEIKKSVKTQITQDSLDSACNLTPLKLAEFVYFTAQKNGNVRHGKGEWAITALQIVLTQLSAPNQYNLKGNWIASGTTNSSEFYIAPKNSEMFFVGDIFETVSGMKEYAVFIPS